MLHLLFPDAYVRDVYSIDYDGLFALGYRGLIFDIDNTLVPHGADSTPEVDAFLNGLREKGFVLLMLSNNTRERVLRFLKNVPALYVCDAEKPSPAGYHKAVETMGLAPRQVIVIGDQVFTDVFGANRSGLKSILVRFIGYDTEKKIGLRRRVEKMVLFCYRLTKKGKAGCRDLPAEKHRKGCAVKGQD